MNHSPLSPLFTPFHLTQSGGVLEHTAEGRRVAHADSFDPIDSGLTALRLSTGGSIYTPFVERQSSLFFAMGTSSRPVTQRPISGPSALVDSAGVAEVQRILTSLETGPNAAPLAFAAARWNSALTERQRDTDKLVDYWIALESVFCPDAQQEVKFRAALRKRHCWGEPATSARRSTMPCGGLMTSDPLSSTGASRRTSGMG